MKRSLYILIILLLCCGLTVWADNSITLSSVQGAAGTEVTVSISMTNTDAVSALQLSIPLGDNLSFVENSQMSGTRLSGHTLSAGVKEGVLNLMVYSTAMTAINGNEGEICSFKLLLGNNPGTVSLNPSRTTLTGTDGSSLAITTSAGAVDVRGAKAKISNNTINFNKVAIGQSSRLSVWVQNVGNEPLEITEITFSSTIFSTTTGLPLTISAGSSQGIYVNCSPTARGDVDEEMAITSNSVSGNSTVRLTATPYAVNELRLNGASGATGEEVTIAITMKNMDDISGMQMEIKIPDGLEYVDDSFVLSDRKQDHAFSASVSGNTLSIVAFSQTDKAFTGSEGEVGSFKVKIVGSSNASLNFNKGMLAATLDGKSVDVLSGKYGCTVSVKSPSIYVYSSLNFGKFSITEDNVQKSLTIRNQGTSSLIINNIVLADEQFSIKEQLPITIEPSSSKNVTVICKAEKAGDINTNMEIYSNDPKKRLSIVKITGRIYEPNTMTCNVVVYDRIPTISMSVDNYSDIYGIQFDLEASINFTLSGSDIHLSDRSEALSVSFNTLSEDKVRVMAYSQGSAFMASGNGEVMSITLTPNEPLEDGNYDITLSNIVLGSKTLSNMYAGTTIVTPFSFKEYTQGDANGDGTVNVIDVVTAIDYILMKNPADFVFTAADVNSDQQVNVIDVVGIIDIILGKWMPAPMRRSVTDGAQDKLLLVKNDDQSLSLCLENQGQYVAAQFDLKLQSGQTLMNIRANEDRAPNHQLSYSEIEPGVYRVLLIGMDNSPLEGQHGEIVNFKIAGGVNGAMIENAQFVTANRKAVNFGTISDITTGIMDIKSARLKNIYSIDGRLMRSRSSTTEELSKGIYIINNNKISVK